jgi:hypothetical protein
MLSSSQAKLKAAAYKNRCTTALAHCNRSNYVGCASKLPNPICYKSDELANGTCSASDKCGALFDFKTSTIRLPKDFANGKDGNPTDLQVSIFGLSLSPCRE